MASLSLHVAAATIIIASLNLLDTGLVAVDAAERTYDIGAYYYPAWHVDSLSEQLHGKNWTEWELVKTAKPRWQGHQMPKVPLWGYEMDDDPVVFEKKIDAAASNGVNLFIFDWYWHQGSGPYLSRGLEQGYLKASNNDKVKFALMWANQPLLDIMPAKHGFRGKTVEVRNGTTDMPTFKQVADHIVTTYFKHPSYYRVRGCPYLSFYQVITLLDSFHHDVPSTLEALDYMVNQTKAQGIAECVHFNGIDTYMRRTPQAAELLKQLKFSSLTSYTWFHNSKTFNSFPVTSYEHATQVNTAYWDTANSTYPIKYIPNVSASWDPSPRTCPTDVFDDSGYPFGATFSSTPDQWKTALQNVKAFMDRTCDPDWCMLTINAWNEWSESAYIEPDTVDEFARLNAIKDVFTHQAI
ncbi:uncharacterized protein WxcX-like [Sycon ciliatum]|uniref:uncharacterized protein WxcX-like n=1 Tax=Sycon ciliatum TaxID=27933 RepID=UPI0031F621E9